MGNLVLAERIEKRILLLRGHKVMLSTDLAELYEVRPKALLQSVKRNMERFPDDFMFQLTAEEFQTLRSQFVTLEAGRGKYPKYPPYAFYDAQFRVVFDAIRELMSPTQPSRRRIGFHSE